MVGDCVFQLAKYQLKDASDTMAIFLVYITDAELTCIEYIHIGLMIFCQGGQIYELKLIPDYIQYIKDNIKYAREKQESSSSVLRVHSHCMFAC